MNLNHCKQCDKPTVNGGLCRHHYTEYKIAQWLDNTDIENLGIVKWAKECMPEFAFNETPDFHKLLYYELLKLYNPDYKNKYERLLEFISFRESAKSTAANTLFVSYILAHNGRSFKITLDGNVREFTIDERTVVIISETGGSAEDFTVRIRDAFAGNEHLQYYYNFTIQEAMDSDTGQWTRAAFKINNCFVQGIGSGMMIRGKVKGASRPSLVIADDIYSENTIITEERRARTRKWWNNAVMNSVDNLRGKVVVLGTILHEDTILVDLENNPLWKTIKIPVMGHVDSEGRVIMDAFHEFIDEYIKVDWETGNCYLPFDDIEDKDERAYKQREFFKKVQAERDWKLNWPARIDLYLMAIKFKEAVHNQTVAGLYQEYFHIVIPPSEKRFKREFFQRFDTYDLKNEYNYNWIRIPNLINDWTICNIEFGIDIAGMGADDAVISVIATLPDYRIFVLHQAIGKWSIRDDLRGDTARDLRRYKVAEPSSRSAIQRVGLADECYRLAKRFQPSKIKVGVAAEEEMIAEEIRRVFRENRDYYTYIMSRPQTKLEGKKHQRILWTLIPHYETRTVYHHYGLTKLEYQLEYLGRTKHDDCADSLECSFFELDFPEKLNYTSFLPPEEKELMDRHKNLLNTYSLTNNWREYF